jgi:hypothetical protein
MTAEDPQMGEFHHVTTKILITVLALETLAFAGCSADKPNKPSATSPALPLPATTSATPSGSATLVGEVERELNAMRFTRYQHATAVDESSGNYLYDCSGFLDYAMGRVLAADLRSIPHTKSRPRAADIEGYLHRGLTDSIDGWQALARADALGPGDVIAWLATEDSTTGRHRPRHGGTTGPDPRVRPSGRMAGSRRGLHVESARSR